MPRGGIYVPRFQLRADLESGVDGSGWQLLCVSGLGQSAECLLRSFLVVFPAPCLDGGACMQQMGEPMIVEALVAELAVERPDVGVLVGFALVSYQYKEKSRP